MDATAVELRVLGCLLEKQRTTPDQYPLSLNALRLACNQTTNRDPVLDLDERVIHDALQSLARRGWTRLASGPGSRAPKYRQLFDEAIGLAPDETAALCVLLLRGAQTPGELKQRTERLHHFDSLGELHETLGRLVERGLTERLDRRPGQKEERYRHLLGDQGHAAAVLPAPILREGVDAGPSSAGLEERVAVLERELDALRAIVEGLRRG